MCVYRGIYYNRSISGQSIPIDFVISASNKSKLVCLRDGHDGIWNLLGQLATPRNQIGRFGLYLSFENLYKVVVVKEAIKQLKRSCVVR